jgi:hypothetical protein
MCSRIMRPSRPFSIRHIHLESWPGGDFPCKNWISTSTTVQGPRTVTLMPCPDTRLELQTRVKTMLDKWLLCSLRWFQQRAGTTASPTDKSRILHSDQSDATSEKDSCQVRRKLHFGAVIDNVLYRVMQNGTLRLVLPTVDRQALFQEAHAGKFGGHLLEHKVYSQLCRHYWWSGMRSDVATWCRACKVHPDELVSPFGLHWYLCQWQEHLIVLGWT